jgi:dTDP-4-dehydrorhamnose reductase
VTGAGGALGSVLMRVLSEQHQSVHGFLSPHGPAPDVGRVLRVELTDPRTYRDRVLALAPRVIIHLAAVSQPSEAYRDPERARAVNVDATVELLELASQVGARFLYASTDLVFDGDEAPYDENAATEPSSHYGRTKLEAECYVLAYRRGLVLRLPLMYGLPEVSREPSFFENTLNALRAGKPVRLFTDEFRSALWIEDAARAFAALARTTLSGVMHLGGPQSLSRFEMGECMARAVAASPNLLVAAQRADIDSPEPRPRDVSLQNARYLTEFGAAVGLCMQDALPIALLRRPHRALS